MQELQELKIVNRADVYVVIFTDPWGNTAYESDNFATLAEAEAHRDEMYATADLG